MAGSALVILALSCVFVLIVLIIQYHRFLKKRIEDYRHKDAVNRAFKMAQENLFQDTSSFLV